MQRRAYEKLPVWQKSMDLAVEVYGLARLFPEEEQEVLIPELMKAAIAVPSKIAEGQGMGHKGEFYRHLSIAHGSLMRVETYLTIAEDLGYLTSEQTSVATSVADEVSDLLFEMMKSLEYEYNRTFGYDDLLEFTEPYEIE